MLAVIFLCAVFWQTFQNAINKPLPLEQNVLIEIEKGDSLSRIAEKLGLALNISSGWLKLAALLQHDVRKLKAGEYEITNGMTATDILLRIASGKTKQYAITFPEGWAFNSIFELIQNTPTIKHSLSKDDIVPLILQLGAQVQNPEGLFFPDTYFFEKNTTDAALLKIAYHRMQSVLKKEWQNRAENLPFVDPYQTLILASIVEKETAVADERPLIAGVFIRRLQAGMLLQTDPTVIYGMGNNYKGNITAADLKQPTPYNTYIIKGLPPTPIAMPGKQAIHAALHPEAGDTLYFVARGDGTHVFSSSLPAHNMAVNTFQKKNK
ncbi:MAG: aminodeoxychorismate lyase [Methylobacter sp.]|nr:MAG: aminodeoxychorismate lyase [Methylobacter sp.]PPD37614.1 MAG: aminodeoxychorismate lyase [Methylomonas sp.]